MAGLVFRRAVVESVSKHEAVVRMDDDMTQHVHPRDLYRDRSGWADLQVGSVVAVGWMHGHYHGVSTQGAKVPR